jgi:hypothetical protein
MRMPLKAVLLSSTVAIILGAAQLVAQGAANEPKVKASPKTPAFWTTTEPFALTLTLNVDRIRRDRADPSPRRPATAAFTDKTDKTGTTTRPARVWTRGISRLKLCDFPPLWVDFTKEDIKQTALAGVERFKLTIPCKNRADYERFIVEEQLIYRLHTLFTPFSHFSRLIRLTVVDSASGKTTLSQYAIAIEDADALAKRVDGKKFAATGTQTSDLDPYQTALIGVLQYMIGNTDFSFVALHNTEIVMLTTGMYPVAYDFDQAGLISTPYAVPSPLIGTPSVRDRVYRGLCVPPDTVKRVFTAVAAKRTEVMALFTEARSLIGGDRANRAVKYLEDFYRDIANPRTAKREIFDKCADGR